MKNARQRPVRAGRRSLELPGRTMDSELHDLATRPRDPDARSMNSGTDGYANEGYDVRRLPQGMARMQHPPYGYG